MTPRSWLTVLKIVFLTVAALVAAHLVTLGIRGRNTPPPQIAPIAPAAAPSAGPAVTEPEAIAIMKPVVGEGSDVTKETPKPVASAAPGGPGGTGPGAVPPVSVPEPSATMTLAGTMVSPGASIAILITGGKEQVVHEGDMIPGSQFTVKDIRDNSIILEMSGVEKTLYLPSFQMSVVAPAPASNPGPALPPPPVPIPAQPNPGADSGKAIIARTERDQVMGNLNVALQDLRILPHKKDGKDYGSRVVFLKPGSFLSKVGLAQEDVLLSVNGAPVNTPEQGMNVFQAFQHEDRIVMQIDRGGRVIQQQVEFR